MRKGYDLHAHFRQGAMTKLVLPMTVRQFAGAVFMPNTDPPITTCEQLDRYRVESVSALEHFEPSNWTFDPLMTFYLTDMLDPDEVANAVPVNAIGAKYYPPGLTTNSESGVKDASSLWTTGTRPYEVLRVLSVNDGTLLLHAANGVDCTGEELDPYDQEIDFVKESLPRIRDAHPDLRITFEHLSTAQGAKYVRENGGPNLGCTVTAQHLLLDRRDTHRKGLHVHRHWWPIIQSKEHRDEVRRLVKEGLPFVFLGTDSAPHPISDKETSCCKGGVLTAHCAMELYAEAFELMGALEKLENFASVFGPKFYKLEPSEDSITLVRKEWEVPKHFRFTDDPKLTFEQSHVHPFRAGEKMVWKLAA
jgi:dihydroorotase